MILCSLGSAHDSPSQDWHHHRLSGGTKSLIYESKYRRLFSLLLTSVTLYLLHSFLGLFPTLLLHCLPAKVWYYGTRSFDSVSVACSWSATTKELYQKSRQGAQRAGRHDSAWSGIPGCRHLDCSAEDTSCTRNLSTFLVLRSSISTKVARIANYDLFRFRT